MDWFLSCFKCGRRRRAGASIAHLENKKDVRENLVAAGLVSANATKEASTIATSGNFKHEAMTQDLGKILTVPGSGLARTSSGCTKTDRGHSSASGHSADHLSLVEKLEEEINSLNEKLVEEASQARILTDEVRHLRQCGDLLDSTDAFTRALDALENMSEKGKAVESKPLLYLQSMLSKIDSEELMMETLSAQRTDERMPKALEQEFLRLSSSNEEGSKPMDKSTELAVLAPGQAQRNSNPLFIEETSKHGEEHPARISVCQPSVAGVNENANKPKLASLSKRRRSTTFSFSGFIVIESDTIDTTVSEHSSSTEVLATKIIETPDTSNANLLEASKSLFAFATTSLHSQSISTEQSPPQSRSEDFFSQRLDTKAESCIIETDVNGNVHLSNNCFQARNTQGSHGLCSDIGIDQYQVELSDESYEGFSDTSCHQFSSSNGGTGSKSSCSEEMCSSSRCKVAQLSIEDTESAIKCAKSCARASPIDDINDETSRSFNFTEFDSSLEAQAESILKSRGHGADFSIMHQNLSDNTVALVLDSEVKHGSEPMLVVDRVRVKALEKMTTCLGPQSPPSGEAKVLGEDLYINAVTPCKTSLTTCSSMSQGGYSTLYCDSTIELSPGEALSLFSPSSDTSSHPFHILSPSSQVDEDMNTYSSETPLTPISVNSYPSMPTMSKNDRSKPQYTPLRTPLPSIPHTETPNSLQSQGSPVILGEDRPILGTVAAHWNHSSSSTKKWWDGKGIPNSTNKYKEDQKVSWHATPFEVRLERALAKQGRVFQKKLFMGAAEMEVSS